VKGLHTRKKEEDPSTKEELPADDKVLAKYEYEGKPDVQDNIDMPIVPPQEELQADNGVLTKYEYSHSRNVMTSQRETLDVAKMLAYMDENYNITSQRGDEDKPTADLASEEPNIRENPYSIDVTYQVANKKESRGLP
jgi:hypothetical protein